MHLEVIVIEQRPVGKFKTREPWQLGQPCQCNHLIFILIFRLVLLRLLHLCRRLLLPATGLLGTDDAFADVLLSGRILRTRACSSWHTCSNVSLP